MKNSVSLFPPGPPALRAAHATPQIHLLPPVAISKMDLFFGPCPIGELSHFLGRFRYRPSPGPLVSPVRFLFPSFFSQFSNDRSAPFPPCLGPSGVLVPFLPQCPNDFHGSAPIYLQVGAVQRSAGAAQSPHRCGLSFAGHDPSLRFLASPPAVELFADGSSSSLIASWLQARRCPLKLGPPPGPHSGVGPFSANFSGSTPSLHFFFFFFFFFRWDKPFPPSQIHMKGRAAFPIRTTILLEVVFRR